MAADAPANIPALLPAPDAAVRERVHCLWDELARLEAARSEEALMHLLGTVADLIGAQNAYWMGAIRLIEDAADPLLGWRPRMIRYVRPLPNDERFTQQRLRSLSRGRVDEATVAQARLGGTFRARRLCDLVSPDWFKSETYEGYIGRGVYDSLTVAAPVHATAECYYGFLRMTEGKPFTEAERDLAAYAMRGLTWFHRQVLLGHGISLGGAPLSPTERRVLSLLLTDRPEKAIAAELGVTPSTAHTYIKNVFRKLGVSGRQGLMSVWLGQQS